MKQKNVDKVITNSMNMGDILYSEFKKNKDVPTAWSSIHAYKLALKAMIVKKDIKESV